MNVCVLIAIPPCVWIPTGPVFAPLGTVAVTCVSEFTVDGGQEHELSVNRPPFYIFTASAPTPCHSRYRYYTTLGRPWLRFHRLRDCRATTAPRC